MIDAAYVNRFISDRNSSGLLLPVARPLKVVIILPNNKSMSGSADPAPTVPIKARPFKIQPSPSV